jgi:hypothetical protein
MSKYLKQRLFILLKRIIWFLSPKLYRKVLKSQHPQTFSIGMLESSSPIKFQRKYGAVKNPALQAIDVMDAPAGFVADPFMVKHQDHWYMFMEVYDRILRRGRIGLAVSTDCKSWKYRKLVLKEDFHLAYPQVLSHDGDHFMVPDSPGQGVRLYRATEFPFHWRYEHTLIDDPNIVDPTLFRHDGLWWSFAGWQDPITSTLSLRLYYAPSLEGSWIEHRCSPVVRNDNRIGRPAGSVIELDGKLVRFAQDGEPDYGSRVRAIEITKLTTTSYEEQEAASSPILDAGSEHWNSGGMHHICAHRVAQDRWVACVDGWYRTDEE